MYEYLNNSWVQLGQDIDGESSDDYSGYAISINSDGSILAIGAGNNDGNGNDAGHVRVFSWDGSSWSQLGQDIDGEISGDFSGEAVSINGSGNIVAIGSHANDGNGNDAGHVRLYKYVNNSWTQLGSDIDGEYPGDNFGHALALNSSGNTIVIGGKV